jgi:hypothetical protein
MTLALTLRTDEVRTEAGLALIAAVGNIDCEECQGIPRPEKGQRERGLVLFTSFMIYPCAYRGSSLRRSSCSLLSQIYSLGLSVHRMLNPARMISQCVTI